MSPVPSGSATRPQATRRKKYCGVSMISRRSGWRRRYRSYTVRRPKNSNDRSRSELMAAFKRGGVGLDEGEHVVGDEALGVADLDRLGEPRDVLVADFLVDHRGEQAGRELGVGRLLDDEAGGRADRQVVEFTGAGTVGERRDGAGGDPHRVDAEQALGGAGDGVDDLVDVDRFERSAALLDPHAARRWARPTVTAQPISTCRSASERQERASSGVSFGDSVAAISVPGVPTLSSISVTRCSKSSASCLRSCVRVVRVRASSAAGSFRGCRTPSDTVQTPDVVASPGPSHHISW